MLVFKLLFCGKSSDLPIFYITSSISNIKTFLSDELELYHTIFEEQQLKVKAKTDKKY